MSSSKVSSSKASSAKMSSTASVPPVCIRMNNLIDLALGTPEVGVVNFNLLHSLLHVIVKQVKIQDAKIEFRGAEGTTIRALIDSGQRESITLSEYIVEKASGEPSEVAIATEERESAAGSSKELVEGEVVKVSGELSVKSKTSETITVVERVESVAGEGGEAAAAAAAAEGEGETTGSKTSSKRLSVVTSSQYNMLEQKVSQLEGQLSDTVPKNKELLLKTQRGSKSVSEMWQMMNMVARMDAAEMGIDKLSSIIEDLAVECNKIANSLGLEGLGGLDTGGLGDASSAEGIDTEKTTKGRQRGGLQGSESILGLIDGILDDFDVLKGEVKELNNVFTTFKATIPEELIESNGTELHMGRISGMDVKFCEIDETITRLDTAFNNQMNIFQDQITDIEKEVMGIWENLNNKAAAEARASGAGEFLAKILVVQEDLENVNVKIHKLNEDKDEKNLRLNTITEEIEIIKTVKADRREVEDLLEEKADIGLMNNKLSIDQFDIAYANLAESLNEAHTKITNQEIVLRNTLDEMQQGLDKKLFREELTPVKDAITEKIRKLHERLKIIENMKKEAEAAGTKSKYLKDVNCISCDNKVSMARGEEVPHFPSFKPMPQHPTMQPFLSYDLDNVRKYKKMAAGQVQEGDMQGINVSVCNRYCGGSHTMTTAQQRLQRGGNFMAQFGMQAIPIRRPDRPSTAPSMRDVGVMVRLSAEMKETILREGSRISVVPGAPEKPKTSKASIVTSGKPASVVSLKAGESIKSRSKVASQRPSAQKVTEGAAVEAGEEEKLPSGAASPAKSPSGAASPVKPASGAASPAKQPSGEKVASAAPSATKRPSGEQVAPAEEEVVPAEGEAVAEEAEDAPAEEEAAPGEEPAPVEEVEAIPEEPEPEPSPEEAEAPAEE